MNRAGRSMRGVLSRRPRDRRVAHPSDPDLLVDYRGVVLGAIIVYGRSIYVEHTIAEGWVGVDAARRPVERTEDWIEATISHLSLDEGQFTALVGQLERWAAQGTVLHYVAARHRLSALFDDTGAYLPLPHATLGSEPRG